jgi:T5orf172 domain
MGKGYIYVIDPHLTIRDNPVVKIGFTTRSPQQRLKELQTSLPHKASLVHTSVFPDAKLAEKWLHRALSVKNVQANGGKEFFFLSPKEAVDIVNALAYQVSVDEARYALDLDIKQFEDKISNGLPQRMMGRFVLAAFVCTTISVILVQRPQSLGAFIGYILASLLIGLFPAIIIGGLGDTIGKMVVRRRWSKEITLERERLLEKYPAAKQIESD